MIVSVPKRIWAQAILIATLLALLSFPIWQLIFTNLTLPVQIHMATDEVEYVRAYWNDPAHHPRAYENIPVASTREPGNQATTVWQIKVEALAEKAPQAKSSQVWVLDVRTPESRVDWSKAKMQPQQWQLMDVPNAPQGKAAVALTEKPQSLQVTIKGSVLTVALLRHPWSGKVRVTANGQVRDLDLFGADATTEELHFKPIAVKTKKADLYEIRVVKTPWHRLRLVSEPITDQSRRVRVDSVQVGAAVVRPEANGEFILPFYVWNQFSCAVAATILSFLGLTILFISIGYVRRQSPELFYWQWFAHDQTPRAIFKVKIANQKFLILPYQAFKYFLASLTVLVIGLSLVEGYLYYQEQKKVIRVQEQEVYQVASMPLLSAFIDQAGTQPMRQIPQTVSPEGQLRQIPQTASLEWQQEDNRINRNNQKKNLTSGKLWNPIEGDWIWRSKGFPVSQVATKPKRILVMGDSFVWGSGYANMNDIWWRQLQRELTRRGYAQVEVIAAGLSGASTHQELEQARKLVPIYKPELVIWGYVTNDPDERVIGQFDYKFVNEDSIVKIIRTLRNNRIFSRINTLLLEARTLKVPQTRDEARFGYEYGHWLLKLLEGKNFVLYQETVKELGQFQRNTGIPGFVMTLPTYPGRSFLNPLYGKVAPLFEAEKIPFYNILESFLKSYAGFSSNPIYASLDPVSMWRINPANGHPGTLATRFHAEQAADILETHYPQVLGKPTSSVKPPTIHLNDWVPYNLNPIASSPGVLSVKYPASEEYMLRLPVNRPFVQFNLESPVALKEIRLSGAGLQTATLDLTAVDSKLKFDTGTIYSFDQKQGTALVWHLEGQKIAKAVNTVRLSADFQNADRQLTLTLIPAHAGDQL